MTMRLLGFLCKCGGEVEVVDVPVPPRAHRQVKERCTSCGRESLPKRFTVWQRDHARQHRAHAASLTGMGDGR